MNIKYSKLLFLLLVFCCFALAAFSYEKQGTTVKREGCNIVIIVQVALETDTEADIAMVQNALNDCFGFSCDIPCKDGSTGKCKITGKVVVLNWNSLSAADKPKFHHITMAPGEGTSYVSGGNVPPNSGKSKTGKWFRHEYSPKVYCHETMHLCGLKDRYRDCRPWRIEVGVDNCKDGKQCTPRQVLDGACPSCDGFEDDVMGQDVTKPYDCGRNMAEVVKLASGGLLTCPDSCCEIHHTTFRPVDSVHHYHTGLIIDGGLGHYHMKNETDKLNLYGINFSIGGNVDIPMCNQWDINAFAKFNYSATSGSQTNGNATSNSTDHYHYHLITFSIGGNAEWKLPDNGLSLYGGPEIGFIVGAKVKTNGTTTYNGNTTPYNTGFTNVTQNKNIQLGINLGVMKQMKMKGRAIKPYFNIHMPLTNEISFPSTKNKLSEFNVGLIYPLN